MSERDLKKVSIIVPAFNVASYIDECLESILNQTYENIEVIAVDDGSKDDTWSHIQYFMAKDSRVKGISQPNGGVSKARNTGLDMATGYYIQFVDGDDFIKSDAVEKLVASLETSGADWINCQYARVDDDNNQLDNYNFITGYYDTATEEQRLDLVRNQIMDYLIGFEVWQKLFLASIIQTNGIRFIEGCKIGEDLAFVINYGFYAKSINCIDERLYSYRVRGGSAMNSGLDLKSNYKEHLKIVKGLKPEFDKAFTSDTKRKYYQLFYKLMMHAFCDGTVREAYLVARDIDDDFYKEYLTVALKHRQDFHEFAADYKVKDYYRFGKYIQTYLTGDLFWKLYFKVYDIYRSIRKRSSIEELKVY